MTKTQLENRTSYWKVDPFEAKRSILANSYSILHKDRRCRVSLDRFLELCAPPIDVTAGDIYIYLSMMG